MRQAVVLIHGIGEQRPMATLRAFVNAVLPAPEPGREKYYSKPDPMSDSYELRRLQAGGRLRTDFYEYYWAYRVEGTKVLHVALWARDLLVRRPSRVPSHLLRIWVILWVLTLATIVGITLGVTATVADLARNAALSFGLAGVTGGLEAIVVAYLGDAARYLSPHPRNIALRQRIRTDGVQLLRRLHDSGRYDRIIVVGHSLGSVIAFDVLRHLWPEYQDVFRSPERTGQPALNAVEAAGMQLTAEDEGAAVLEWQRLQTALWMEQRSLGNPWLVTDLVTIGSPLAHAGILMAADPKELSVRQRERELPTCPPRPDGRRYSYWRRPPYESSGQKVSLAVLHHAALYAATRWTNVFFPAKWAIFGDLVGGKLRPVFGGGIRDIPVTSGRWANLARFTPFVHTWYWRPESAESISSLRQSLALEALRRMVPRRGRLEK